jgi:hypothetical protein
VRAFLSVVVACLACTVSAQSFQWSGFALVRGASNVDSGPLRHDSLSSQVQVGLEWWANPMFGIHVHLLGRTDAEGRRGRAGIPEAYAELNLRPKEDRLRVRAGAMFLPSSRENVDALWENPYSITSSALNSWLGEEFRPIGVDVSYFRRRAFAGATLFRGNDTFGAIPPARGWSLGDHWTLLGEWVAIDPEYFTSVSAENDGRHGWSARGGWNGDRLFVQATHIANRSDGMEYGHLFNWGTRFDIVSAETTVGDWTFATEYGWGPTFLVVEGMRFTNELDAAYVLASRRSPTMRGTIRVDSFRVDEGRDYAVTLAYLWTGIHKTRLGVEITKSEHSDRVLLEVRYAF